MNSQTSLAFGCLPTGGTAAPVDDLGLVDLITGVVGRSQARHGTHGAIHVDHLAAGATDQVVMVVTHPILISCGGPRRLDAPEQTDVGQHADGVVDRAMRDGTDVGPDGLDHFLCREMRSARHRPQDGQALCRDLEALLPKQLGGSDSHFHSMCKFPVVVKSISARDCGVPRRNRVDPFGDLHAVPQRMSFTGNRGCLVDDSRALTRHHNGSLWIICVTEFRGWRHPLDQPHRWTPLFFLDDAVALAAGHRPCAFCRGDAYRSYRDAVTTALGRDEPLRAIELNARLNAERLRRGRGLRRGSDRRRWTADLDDLPDGSVVVGETGAARLVHGESTWAFSFDGWVDRRPRSPGVAVEVITPPTSVAALLHGFEPALHWSVTR